MSILVIACVAALVTAPVAADDPQVERLAGENRFETAAAVSEGSFGGGADVVYVATGQDFPDALAAAPIAAGVPAPILLVTRDIVPRATAAELDRLAPDRIVVLGGQAAVSERVTAELERHADQGVERVAGRNRYATAAALSREGFSPGVGEVLVAGGEDFPDALAGGAAAASRGVPVLLVGRDVLPERTAEELRRLEPGRITVLGGPAAVSDDVVEALRAHGEVRRLAGRDRIGTAVAVSRDAFTRADAVYLATAGDFPDALTGGPVAGVGDAPVLLTPSGCVAQPVLDEIDRLDPDRVVLLGGQAVLDDRVERLASCERETTVVASGLVHPWDLAFTPDGRTFVTERDSGRLIELVDGSLREVQRFDVASRGEGGLLGLAASPTYADDGLLYAYLTTASDNRVVRFRPGEPATPVLTGIPRSSFHNGGRIAFGPDGSLYVATGDATSDLREADRRAQDPDHLGGKVLRIRPDGSVPADNPFDGSPVWSLGHRNVQGLAWDALDRLFISELGPECDDEINRIVRGGNYGWVDGCGETRPGAIPPVVIRQPAEASWSGATFLVDGAIPEWEGDLLVAALRGQRLWRLRFDDDAGLTESEQLLVGELGRLRHVAQAPDGSVWILTTNGTDDRIVRIGPPR